MNKSNKHYNTKSALGIKDLDDSKREVAIYLSTFDALDSDNDVIKKGAFKKSIADRGPLSESNRKIAFLRFHDWTKPIGTFKSLEEDSKGLFAVGKLGNSTLGEDAFNDYKDGIIKEHSIGFQYVKDKTNFIEDKTIEGGGYTEVKEVKLWEGSAVTFGANEFTNVVQVKGELRKDKAEELFNEITTIQKALKDGQGSDERLESLEMRLKYLTSAITLLAKTEPEPIHLEKQAKEVSEVIKPFDWGKVFSSLESKQTYSNYPDSAVNNAKKGIKLNEENGNKCATLVGRQRARDIVAKRGLSLDTVKRVYSYLSRAEEYYNPSDTKACGTISFLLWGGLPMKTWAKRVIDEVNN